MTATEVFIKFLKTELTSEEYIFFMYHLSRRRRCGHAKPFLAKGCVEEYLSNTRRTLGGFMTRLFVLCPNLIRYGMNNPTYEMVNKNVLRRFIYSLSNETDAYYFRQHVNSKYVSIYRTKWRNFLDSHILSEKSINSPYKQNESYSYEYLKK